MAQSDTETSHESFSIRLLHVHSLDLRTHDTTPSKDLQRDLVSCSTSRWPLLQSPPYVALSYVWGDQHDTTTILVDADKVQVTKNLEEALRHFRDHGETSLPWWIDAICINQQDQNEKTTQVSHMREIYSRAQYTMSWLGLGRFDGCTKLGMRWLRDFGSRALKLGIGKCPEMYLRVLLLQLEDSDHRLESQLEEFLKDLLQSLDSMQNPAFRALLAGLHDVLEREYWTRIWIVQEMAVAPSVYFACEDDRVDGKELDRGVRLLRNFRRWQQTRQLHQGCDSMTVRTIIDTDPARPLMLLNIRRQVHARPLIQLLTQLKGSKASDPRDLVFALLGVASDVDRLGLHVDYTKTTTELYVQVAVTLLAHGHMSLLSSCSGTSELCLPSWVPDWSQRKSRLPLQQWSTIMTSNDAPPISVLQPNFTASGDLEDVILGAEQIAPGVLGLQMLILGKVEFVGDSGTAGEFTEWIHSVQSLLEQLNPHSDRGKYREPLWRVAVADQDVWRGDARPRMPADCVQKLEAEFGDCDIGSLDSKSFSNAGLGSYQLVASGMRKGRSPLLISGPKLGIGPADSLCGDIVATIPGACVPYVLRMTDSHETYRLVGEAYVDGFMDGEACRSGVSPTMLRLL